MYCIFYVKKLKLKLKVNAILLGILVGCSMIEEAGGKKYPNRYSTSSGSWGELLGNYLKLLDHKLPDYKLTHMVKIGPNIFMITLLFCLRQHFSVMT